MSFSEISRNYYTVGRLKTCGIQSPFTRHNKVGPAYTEIGFTRKGIRTQRDWCLITSPSPLCSMVGVDLCSTELVMDAGGIHIC